MSRTKRSLLDASVLFSREELPWYVAWWQENHKVLNSQEKDQEGKKEEGEGSKKQDRPHSPSTSATANNDVQAARCKHILHPGHPATTSTTAEGSSSGTDNNNTLLWCPKCILAIHARILNELWRRWAALGGPWRQLPNGAKEQDYHDAKQAFRTRKVDLVNTIDDLETIAQLEAAWEAANPDADIPEVVKEHGAVKTVESYHLGHALPEGLTEENVLPPRTPTSMPRKAKMKRLSYSPGTPEDTRHQPSNKYARGFASYDPDSPHACPNEEGWADTALRQDWRFNVRQCRLLYCDKDPQGPNVTYKELSDEKSKDRLLEAMDMWMAKMENGWSPRWTAMFQDTSDIFLAWKGDGDGENEDENGGFSCWDKVETLVGTNLEAHALEIGDIDHEDFVEYERAQEEARQMDATFDDSDEDLIGMSSDPEDSDDELF
ncbi:hypothetical protein T440DRAFT_506787 [Plenodomus tracheiphilus IPT5]|uniref:Uncharacterized protein n=1 Tax=Plenodomus tracheiphilus IPT5 TaxID=1408161 RepID=A0A6A7BDG5_9PLEO|nr:hypothetical protein T440DRAFT_506787 [Plenodomus tracheiphilus IPT5]